MSPHLNAVDLDPVGTLARRDAVLHLQARQIVPPQRRVVGLKHTHVHATRGQRHLGGREGEGEGEREGGRGRERERERARESSCPNICL